MERRSFFQRLRSFLDASKRTVLVGDWNVILNPNIYTGWGASRLGRCDSSLINLLAEFDLIDRFHLDHPGRKGDVDVTRKFALWPDPVLSGQSVSEES